jgi:hypothetical protein
MAAHVLEPAEFWKIRALGSETQRAQLAANVAVGRAQAKQDAVLAELAAKYGFDPKSPTFTLDDDTLTLTIADEKKP